jgi:hypothetical protein
MHTDEYEISIGREIALCRKMVQKLKDSLARREKQGNVTTIACHQASADSCQSEKHAVQSWNQEYQRLQHWQKLLADYEAALESLKEL